jgi:WD40 repeat protein
VRAWSLSGQPARSFVGHTRAVSALACARGALFTASADGTVRAWQVRLRGGCVCADGVLV